MPARFRRRTAALAAALLVLLPAGCTGTPADAPGPTASPVTVPSTSPVPTSPSVPVAPPTEGGPSATAVPRTTMVLAISVDGLASGALARLGPRRAPTFWRLIDEGASTLNARTAVELTVTLPNHAGMLTGRPIDADRGGHGWTVNVDNGGRVTGGGPDPVASVFDVVDEAGGSTALFTSKQKFAVFDRSWPVIEEYVYEADNAGLVRRAAADLVAERRAFTFLHLSAPDDAGHRRGWASRAYLRAVQDVDRMLGELLRTIEADPFLERRLVLVLTADHGGRGRLHGDASDPASFTVPFLVVGPGVPARADLYALDPTRRDPGTRQPGYGAARGPVRNGDVANLATSLLGLGPVPGSRFGAERPLAVRPDR